MAKEIVTSFPVIDPFALEQEERIGKRDILPNSIGNRLLETSTDPFTINVRINKDDPAVILDALVSGDTDYWMGSITDADGTDDDVLEFGTGTTPGTGTFLRMNASNSSGPIISIIQNSVAATSPILYFQLDDPLDNYFRFVASDSSGLVMSWDTHATGGSVNPIITFSGSTGTASTTNVVAFWSGGNMRGVVAGSTALTTDSTALEINGGNFNIWHTRVFNFVHNSGSPGGAGTKYPAMFFNGTTLTLVVGPSNSTAKLSLQSGSSNTVVDWDTSGNAVFNETGASIDHRFEGNTDVNLLFLDGSADSVGIGTSTPATKLEVAGIAAVKQGASTSTSKVGGVANVNITAVGNVGTGEDNLITYSLPASSLGTNGDFVEIEAWGTLVVDAGTKNIKLYFGSTVIKSYLGLTTETSVWRFSAIVIRTGAATQDAIAFGPTGDITSTGIIQSNFTQFTTPAETLSGAITIKCTGEGVNNNDIVQEGMIVKWYSNA